MKEILFYEEGVELPAFFSGKLIEDWLDVIAFHYSRRIGALSFVFCNDDYILDVNRKYLDHDYYTDVITFDYCDGQTLSGDVFISLDTVRSNAVQFGVDFESEFHRVVCHSVLHLIGFKDKTDPDSAMMRENENICLDLLKTV
ncbi:MAG: rRNA maturation RNase YbeY [Oscillibacter sp.]|nr:rRNA maturation RNase YbeY [Oscillibacter sp.]